MLAWLGAFGIFLAIATRWYIKGIPTLTEFILGVVFVGGIGVYIWKTLDRGDGISDGGSSGGGYYDSGSSSGGGGGGGDFSGGGDFGGGGGGD